MATIEDLKERKKKLEQQIKEKEQKFEQSVGRYFLKKYPADTLTEAKSTIDELTLQGTVQNEPLHYSQNGFSNHGE